MSHGMPFHPQGQSLNSRQARDHAPSDYENILGDALERAFAAGVHDLEGVVRGLMDYGVPAPEGKTWDAALLAGELKRLGR